MKKGIYVIALVLLSVACKQTTKDVEVKEERIVHPPTIIGNDNDEFGCKTSAGYSWSKIKQECIRIWEDGIKLYPIDQQGGTYYGAAVVLAEDTSKAELFINGEKESIWLAKFHEEKNPALVIYSGREYKFFEHKGDWILEYKGKNVYTSAE